MCCKQSWGVIMDLRFTESGFEHLVLTEQDTNINLVISKRVEQEILLEYQGMDVKRNMNIHVEEGARCTLLMKNTGTSKNNMSQTVSIDKDGQLKVAFWEIENGESVISLDSDLLASGASINVKSACIAQADKTFTLLCTHDSPYTESIMENYAIVRDQGHYAMEATGKIKKGAHESNSHQTTRVLTLSDEHNSTVLPVLLIDENDVKASHATTVGQPDENQLYYLQSRGLSREQALGLLTLGYLMPISELFKERKFADEMKNEIEKRVGLHA